MNNDNGKNDGFSIIIIHYMRPDNGRIYIKSNLKISSFIVEEKKKWLY
jgi:hypothetical protein